LSSTTASAQLLTMGFSGVLEIQADVGDTVPDDQHDQYLCGQTVSRKNLQLVGVTTMLLATKYKEILGS
jgi:hypothetical protein